MTKITLILRNKMVAPGIPLKIIYIFYWLVLETRRLNLFIGDMYTRYICPLPVHIFLTLKHLIQGHSAKVPHVADFKSANISLIIGPGGVAYEADLLEIMSSKSSDVVTFDLGPLLQDHMRIANFKSTYNSLITCPRGLQCVTNLEVIMGWESSDVVKFDLGPLLQGQMGIANSKVLITCLLLVLLVCNVKPTYGKSWAGNLPMWSDLASAPSST